MFTWKKSLRWENRTPQGYSDRAVDRTKSVIDDRTEHFYLVIYSEGYTYGSFDGSLDGISMVI